MSDQAATRSEAGRAALARLRSAADRLRATVTPAGWALALLGGVGAAAGAAFGFVEAWVVAVVCLVLLAASVPFLLGDAVLDVRFRLTTPRVVAGGEVAAVIEVVNAHRRVSLPGILDIPVGDGLVEAYLPLLRPGARHAESIRIPAPRRSVIRVGPLNVTRGDPIGILRREHRFQQVEEVFVHPVTVRLPTLSAGRLKDLEGAPTSTIVDSDLAFHAIRDYLPGDSRRHVHWKSTAKTGTLMVRQFEETRRARVAVLLDLAADGYASEEEFELAVSAAASIAVQAVLDGREVRFLVPAGAARGGPSGEVGSLPTSSPKGLLDATSRLATAQDADRLETLARLVAESTPELSIAVMVTGSTMSADRVRRAAFAFPVDARAVVVAAEPDAEPRVAATRDASRITVGALGDLPHLIARGAFA